MSKYKTSNFKIFACDQSKMTEVNKELNVKQSCLTRTQSIKDSYSKKTSKKKSSKPVKCKENEDNDSDNDSVWSEEPEPASRRVERFLSIVELPQEVVYLTQKAFARRHSVIAEEDEEIEVQTLQMPKKTQIDPAINNNTFAFYQQGYGLSQEQKANIISEIIANFNLSRYLNEFKEKDSVVIKLKKNERKDRPIRDRLMKLMKSDEIRINDSRYMRRLSKQIERSYEDKQERLMQNLIENERKRERMLKHKGLLSKTSEEDSAPERRFSRADVHSPHLTDLSLRKIQLR